MRCVKGSRLGQGQAGFYYQFIIFIFIISSPFHFLEVEKMFGNKLLLVHRRI